MGTKPQMKHKYKTIREIGEDAPVVYCKRTSSDEEDLTKLKSKEVAIGDTDIGRLCDTHKKELDASYKSMSPRSKSDTIKKFKQWHNPVNGDEE